MVDDTKCEFVVGSDIVMTDSLKYADIILPDLFRFEQDSMITTGGDDAYMIFGQPCVERKFERKTNYEWVAELAELMGVGEEFTEGKTELEWIEGLYEQSRENNPDLPTLEEFRAQGVVTRASDEPTVALAAFREDPEANPLSTPSGKIEIYSEALDEYIQTHEFADDDFVAPVPVYAPEWYGVETTTEEYPLVCTGFHYRGRLHSSWGNVEILKKGNPQEVWINPADAESRGISQGDTVRCQNDFGTIELLAKVTPRVIPGVVAIPQGAWHDADMDGDRVDKGGNINTLATLRPSPLAKGNPQHTNICQVVKA
jgi:Tat-targeted selenate reductase subunit YnfE